MAKPGKNETIMNLIKNRTPLFHKKFPLIIFWTPKSGCTTMVKWFFFQIGLLQRAKKCHTFVHKFRIKKFQKQKNYRAELRKELEASKKYTVKLVRNPYRRAVSSFLHVISHKRLMKDIGLKGEEGISFKQFLYHMKRIGVKDSNPHVAQQYVENEEKLIKEYIYLEKFNESIKKLEKKYNLSNAPFKKIILSKHHKAEKMIKKGEYSDVIITKEMFKSGLPTYESFYDKETQSLVAKLYEKDFLKYGYDIKKIR
jgi:hypothetical protein